MAQLRSGTATDPSKGHGLEVTYLVQHGCLDLFFSKSPLHGIRGLGGCFWVEGREAEGTGKEDCKHLSATYQLLGHCKWLAGAHTGEKRPDQKGPRSPLIWGARTPVCTAINTGCPPRTAASRHLCCSRAGAFLTASLLLLLATLGALLALVAILGLPPRTPGQCGFAGREGGHRNAVTGGAWILQDSGPALREMHKFEHRLERAWES